MLTLSQDRPMSAPGDTEMMRDAQFELLRFVQAGANSTGSLPTAALEIVIGC